jgi:phosphotransferase system HPr (HPr) family protein
MNGETLQRLVTVANPQGLHMRPAAEFAKTARRFQSDVLVRFADKSVDGKSILDLITLAAEHGSQLVLEISGDDAHDALAALECILEVCDWDEVGQTADPSQTG